MSRQREILAWSALIGSIAICGPCAACGGLFSVGGIGALIDSTQPYTPQFSPGDWFFLVVIAILTIAVMVVGLIFFAWGVRTLLRESN